MMNFFDSALTPTTLLFIIIVVGYFVGKIKIYGVSLDLSAILLIAVLSGYLLSIFCPNVLNDNFNNSINLFSKLGTSLFVAAIGISSGYSVTRGMTKKNVVNFIIGAFIAGIGLVVANIISWVDVSIEKSVLFGIICGALTSTPALAVVCESQSIYPELATIGYGTTYLFGVIGVVVFVQYFLKESKIRDNVRSNYETLSQQTALNNLIYICMAAIIGEIVGNYEFPYICFSLGNTGGILLSGVILGFLINKCVDSINISHRVMSIYRNFGLIMFFIGTGISAGQHLNSPLEIKWFIYGIVITVASITIGYIGCRCLIKDNIEEQMCIIAGGMTSTPAMATILKKSNAISDAYAYSSAYLGALVMITVGVKILLS